MSTALPKTAVKVLVSSQGDVELSDEGYYLIQGKNEAGDEVAAFYIDAWGKTGRAWPLASISTATIKQDGAWVNLNCPSVLFEPHEEDSAVSSCTEVYFPEYEGWDVHSIRGGKTVAMCLVKRNKKK